MPPVVACDHPALIARTRAPTTILPPAFPSMQQATREVSVESQQQQQHQLHPPQPTATAVVRFNPTLEIIPAPSPLDYCCTTIRGALWYQTAELDVFRTEVREACRRLRSTIPEDSRDLHLAADVSTRGMEQRACMERQRRRHLSKRLLLRAQAEVRDADRLAAISLRCTAWATELASEEGTRDFRRAYNEEEPAAAAEETSDASQKKRSFEQAFPASSGGLVPATKRTAPNCIYNAF